MNILRLPVLVFSLLIIAFNANAEFSESMTINDIHQQIKAHKLSSEELVSFYLARIKKFDDNGMTLNSVVQLNKSALKQAKA